MRHEVYSMIMVLFLFWKDRKKREWKGTTFSNAELMGRRGVGEKPVALLDKYEDRYTHVIL